MKMNMIPGLIILFYLFSISQSPAETTPPQKKTRNVAVRATPSLKKSESEGKTLSNREINDRLTLTMGLSIPMDNGRGYPKGFGYFLWKRSAWPWTSTDFKLAFAGVIGDAELTLRDLVTRDTDLGFGLYYQTIGRFEEYNRGQINIGERMGITKYSGRLFLQQHIVANLVEIAQLRATYEYGYAQYYHEDDTVPTFRLANSSLFQSVKLNGDTGKLNRSNYSPSGWDLNFEAEATFRDNWQRWGPDNLWDSPSEFQKFHLGTTWVISSVAEQKLVATLTGGVGNGLDRLSTYKLGGSLDGLPDALVLHGFYMREIFAEDFSLLNLDYVIPILEEQQLALHLYADGAVTRRTDVPDRSLHGWAGTGTGLSFKGWWDTKWLVGYGYGINAQRGTEHGSHEIFTKMLKEF